MPNAIFQNRYFIYIAKNTACYASFTKIMRAVFPVWRAYCFAIKVTRQKDSSVLLRISQLFGRNGLIASPPNGYSEYRNGRFLFVGIEQV